MESTGNEEHGLLDELRQALNNNQGLALYLQPQINIANGQCTGAEALLRWQRSSGEWIAPPRILDAIDRLGMRQTFNRWLLHQATQIQLQLAEQGIDIVLSINLSANDLLDIELPDMIGQVLATWDIAPDRILLEITETIMVDESWQVLDVLNRMRKLGLHLSIDDFGTGYAGLSYLQRLPVQEVKIDQMFVRQAAESEKAREIITSIIQLATKLNMSVIAEGVETTEILGILSALGCRFAQGYLFSKALPMPAFIDWWQENQTPA
jgi:EAL domain-containing protein (putative c-di-GMP-specific phosphodiesterase class I)